MCVNDRFSKSFKTYLGRDAIHNFLNRMIEECNYCTDVMKKHFNKELVMAKDNEDFQNFTKCWICDNNQIENDVKTRDHVILLENVEALCLEIVISMLN